MWGRSEVGGAWPGKESGGRGLGRSQTWEKFGGRSMGGVSWEGLGRSEVGGVWGGKVRWEGLGEESVGVFFVCVYAHIVKFTQFLCIELFSAA